MGEYDVGIVGASVSGCVTATLLARQGARVLLVDRIASEQSYKTACTHFIQAGALPAIERIGLKEELDRAGAVPTTIDAWTPWGWVQPRPGPSTGIPPHGYNIRRQTLDPLLRRLAAQTPGVEVALGWKLERLGSENGALDTLHLRHRDGRTRQARVRLVIGADGRDSAVAKQARVPCWRAPNNRVAYFAQYADLPLEGGSCRMWFLNPDGAAAFATDGGITVLSAMLARDHAALLAADLEQRFDRFFARLPWAPSVNQATRVSKVIGRRDMTTITRPPAWAGSRSSAMLPPPPIHSRASAWAGRSSRPRSWSKAPRRISAAIPPAAELCVATHSSTRGDSRPTSSYPTGSLRRFPTSR